MADLQWRSAVSYHTPFQSPAALGSARQLMMLSTEHIYSYQEGRAVLGGFLVANEPWRRARYHPSAYTSTPVAHSAATTRMQGGFI